MEDNDKNVEEHISLNNLSEKLFSEIIPFKEEISNYKEVILKTIIDIISIEIYKLRKTQREVIYLYYFSGKSLREIASFLNISVRAVMFRRRTAIKTLKKQLMNNPYIIKLYKEYIDPEPDLPSNFLEKTDT